MSTDLSSPSTKSTTSYRPLTTYSRRSNRRSHPSQSTSNSVNDPTALSSNDSSPPSAMNPYDSEDNTISETERRLKKRAKHSQSQLHSQSVYVDVPTLSHSRSRELVAQRPSQSHARNATNGTNATSTFASGTLAGESAMTSSTTVDLEGSGHASKRFKIPSQPVSASTALSVSQPRTNKRHMPSNAAHISTSTANSPTNNTISSGLVSFPLMHRSTSYPAQDPPQDIDFSQFKTPANAESLSPVQPPPIDPNRGRNRDGIAHARPRNKQRDLEGRDPLSGSQSRHGGGGRRSGSAGAGRDTKAFSPVPVPRVRQKDVNVNRNRQQNAPDGTASGQFKAPALPQSKPQSQPQSRSQSKSRRISSRKLKENATAATTTATSTSFRCGQGQGQILGEGLSRSGRATPALGFPLASPYQTKPSSPTQPSLAPAPVRKSLGSPGEIIGLGGGSGVGGGGGGGDEASIVRNRGSGKKKPAFYTKTRTMSDAKVYDEQLRADRDQDGFVLPVGRAHPQRPRASRNGTGVGDGSGVGEGGSRGGGSFGAAALREYAYSQSVIHSPTRRDKDLPLQYEGPGITLKSSRFKSNGKPPATRFPSNRNVHDQPPHSKTSHRPHPGQMQEEGLPASAPGPVSGMLDLSQISSEQWHKPAKVFSLAKSQSQSHSLSLSRRRGSCDEEINLDELLYPPNETPPVFEVGYGYGGDFGYGHGYGYGLQDDGDGEYEVPQVSERSLGSREASMHLEGDEEAEFGGAMRYKAGWLNLEPDEEEAGKGGVDDEDGEESMDLTLQALDSIRRPSGSRSRSQDEVGLGLGFSLDPGADVEMGAGTGWLMGSAFGTGNTLEVGDEGERSMSMEGTSFRGPPSTPPRSTRSSSFFADVPMGTSTPFRRKQRELLRRIRLIGWLLGVVARVWGLRWRTKKTNR